MMLSYTDILRERDPDDLKTIASAWGIPLTDPNGTRAYQRLAAMMADPSLAEEIISTLPETMQTALKELAQRGGKMAWEHFTRQYGEVRVMGEARRSKIRPHENPQSTSEALWYRGLIGRIFQSLEGQSVECAVLPSELYTPLGMNQPVAQSKKSPFASSTRVKGRVYYADTVLVDHLCTLIAGQRAGIDQQSLVSHLPLIPLDFLSTLLLTLIKQESNDSLSPQRIKSLLENPRHHTLKVLFQLWRTSADINEIHDNPYFTYQGNWQPDVPGIRTRILDLVMNSGNTWVDIHEWLIAIHTAQPNVLRKAGEYDTRLISDRITGQPLRGLDSWMQVEGRFLRYMLTGPLFFFGMIRLMGESPEKAVAFQVHPGAVGFHSDQAAKNINLVPEKITINAEGIISVPILASLTVRYHLARFCDWLPMKAGNYRYRPTPRSLQNAHKNGLLISQLLALLSAESKNPLSPALITALQRWESSGFAARLENATIIRVHDATLLDRLAQSPSAKYILERLNEKAIVINAAAIPHVRRAFAELGTLLDEPPTYNQQ